MTRLYLLVEGQTEETFIRELIAPHYARQGLFVTPILSRTSPMGKGGVTSYGKIRHQLTRLCRQDSHAHVSTFFDLYGLPNDFPGKSRADFPAQGTGEQKAIFLEECLTKDIDEPNFTPYLMVHEFEAFLFVKPEAFGEWTNSLAIVDSLIAISRVHDTPEHINDSPQTAPSKRILRLMPEYKKTFHGPLIALEIGLESLRKACPHFHSWLLRLDQFLD